jgi:RES domain-containing protein
VTHSQELLNVLAQFPPTIWEGTVFRHMFGDNLPERENTMGARWNPSEVPAIYTSLEAATAEAEGDYQIAMQPLKPKAERRIHRIRVRLNSVLDLRDPAILAQLQIDPELFGSAEPFRCQEIGGAIAHLGHDGLLTPSARSNGTNLTIFPSNKTETYEFAPIDFNVIP